jgi:hypothetical protein
LNGGYFLFNVDDNNDPAIEADYVNAIVCAGRLSDESHASERFGQSYVLRVHRTVRHTGVARMGYARGAFIGHIEYVTSVIHKIHPRTLS